MSAKFTSETNKSLKRLIERKSKDEVINMITQNIKTGLKRQSADIKELLDDEEFLSICNDGLGFDVKEAVSEFLTEKKEE